MLGEIPVDLRFRQAAWAYFGYGVIYLATALSLQLGVFPVRGFLLLWFAIGAVITIGVPWVLMRRRLWFERWILSRRDFARLLAVLVAVRAVVVTSIALRGAGSTRMASLGGGVPAGRAGACAMALVALATAVMLARAAWAPERSSE